MEMLVLLKLSTLWTGWLNFQWEGTVHLQNYFDFRKKKMYSGCTVVILGGFLFKCTSLRTQVNKLQNKGLITGKNYKLAMIGRFIHLMCSFTVFSNVLLVIQPHRPALILSRFQSNQCPGAYSKCPAMAKQSHLVYLHSHSNPNLLPILVIVNWCWRLSFSCQYSCIWSIEVLLWSWLSTSVDGENGIQPVQFRK